MRRILVLAPVLALVACQQTAPTDPPAEWDLGGFHHAVRTDSDEAQLWFDRGLALCHGFHHAEAIRCFREAQAADPGCAMAYWGASYAAGPNINDMEMDAEESETAWTDLQAALARFEQAAPVERALIEALSHRYSEDNSAPRDELNRAYADAMREVAASFPDDPTILALFAESLMDLRPWALWSPDGSPAPETAEVRAALERGMEIEPDHPALCHFYIHTMEASPWPELAEPAADRLRRRVPCSGHLVHMPSHIDIQIGRYDDAVRANQRGIAADLVTAERTGRENFYTFYRAHNYHFLVYAAMFDGQSRVAIEAARELVDEIPAPLLAAMPDFLDAFVPTPLHALVRFGRWEEILAEPQPAEELCVTTATWHYARGIASAVLGRIDQAEAEQRAFEQVYSTVPDSRRLFQNACRDTLSVAQKMLEGELAYRRGDHDEAFAALREAVARDDSLNYDEPWGWMQPARHALGALLLEQGRVEEAEAVYRADLARHPRNGWSMHGLAECLQRLGNEAESDRLSAELEDVWARADVPLRASCLCRTTVLE